MCSQQDLCWKIHLRTDKWINYMRPTHQKSLLPTAILSIIVYLEPDISRESLKQMQLFNNMLNPMLFISVQLSLTKFTKTKF